jgi:hypothetical protein
MLTGEPRVPVAHLRAAVRDAIERTSARAVAREIGMSAPSVRDFAAGSAPRPSTIRKLTMWYLRYWEETGRGELDARTAQAAITLLFEHVPAAERPGVREDFYEWLARKTAASGAREPRWVREARRTESQG